MANSSAHEKKKRYIIIYQDERWHYRAKRWQRRVFARCMLLEQNYLSANSNTDLSDLSFVGRCDILVYQMRHEVM